MAIEVISTIPNQSATDFLMDAAIDIKFNKEIHSSSLTTSNFKLYVMPGYVGQVNIAIIKIGDGKTIRLAPINDLTADQSYQAVIMGDHDIADSVIQGITSTDSDVMDGNYLLNFKTGSKRRIDINSDVVYDEAAGSDYFEGRTGISYPLQVVSTDPSSYDTQVDDASVISVTFSDTSHTKYNDAIEIRAESLVFGDSVSIPTVSGTSNVDARTIEFYTDNDISNNTEYTVVVDKSLVSGGSALSEFMVDDYVFRFLSPISPYYTNPRTVRLRGGALIPDALPDYTIWQYILDASVWANNELLITQTLTPDLVPEDLNRLVTCKVIYEIAYAITFGRLRGIRSKQLADLRIDYDTKFMKDTINDFLSCWQDALYDLGKSRYNTGVKSGGNTKYPRVRRPIHSSSWTNRNINR